jgi:hypothetical protein
MRVYMLDVAHSALSNISIDWLIFLSSYPSFIPCLSCLALLFSQDDLPDLVWWVAALVPDSGETILLKQALLDNARYG